MKHAALLAFVCQQAEKDLRTGHGIGYAEERIDLHVQGRPFEAGGYQVAIHDGRGAGTVLLHPNDDFLENLLKVPHRVEHYIATIREVAWKWAHQPAQPVLVNPDKVEIVQVQP